MMTLRLSVADARDLAEGALRGIGYHNDEARIIADHVIDAAMCGYEYSGLAKILNVFESEHFRLPRRSMKVSRETEVSLAFDGGNNVGMLALFHAAQATIKKTAAHGIALVSVTDAWMSGRAAYYVEMIAKHGLVAIHTASSSPLVAPPGGIRPVLGTNPIAIAVPSSRGPIVLDMGTSAYMMTGTCCLRANENSRPLRCLIFRGSIPHPMQLLCTLRDHCRQGSRNTRYQAGAAPYLGRSSTGWIAPACLAHSFDHLVGAHDHLVGAQQECLWDREPERLDSRQICVLPGTELAFAEEVKCAPFSLINWTVKTIESRTAIFRQVNKDIPRVHHDALEFADGTHVLLTDLLDGQEATVLQLPAQPKTPAEEAAQRRVACVG
jgi:Malate/L-lactate dehydrogenase